MIWKQSQITETIFINYINVEKKRVSSRMKLQPALWDQGSKFARHLPKSFNIFIKKEKLNRSFNYVHYAQETNFKSRATDTD